MTSSKSIHFPANVFGSILNSPSSAISALSSQIDSSSPVSLTIAMKLQPKKRYRKFKLPEADLSPDESVNPIVLKSDQVNSAVGLLLKRTGHLNNEISAVRSTRKPKYRVSKITVPGKNHQKTRPQSALAKFEIKRQKTGLQSKPVEQILFPIQLSSERSRGSDVFPSNRKRKVKFAKQNFSLVGSLITAPPSDKSKLTIPKPMSDWSDRRIISSYRPKVTTPRTVTKSKPIVDEMTSPSKKSESTLHSGKIIISPTTPNPPFEVTNKPKMSNSQKQIGKDQQSPSVNIARNLGNHGAVLLASGQLSHTNKSKITRVPLEPLDYETELDKSHSENLMERTKQLGPYELSPFSAIETSGNENIDRVDRAQEPVTSPPSQFTRSPLNQISSSVKPNSKFGYAEEILSTPPTTSNYDYKRNRGSQSNAESSIRSIANAIDSRRNNIIKYDYGHFGERMVPLRQSDSSFAATTPTTSTTTTTTPKPSVVIATNQPVEPSNVYFDSNPTPSSNEMTDSELETVRENDIDAQETTTTADPLIEGNLVIGSTVTPWSWDDSASGDGGAGDDGLLVSPLFASSNDDDEIQRNQEYKQTSPQESTTTPSVFVTERPFKDQTSYTKMPTSDVESGRDTTRYFFPFELKYLAQLCKNSSAFGLTNSVPTTTPIPSTSTSTTTTPRPTSRPIEELTVERSQIDESLVNYGDRPIGRGRKNRYNMKKVAYQYKPLGNSIVRQSSPSPPSTANLYSNERRYKTVTSQFSPNKRRPEPITTTTPIPTSIESDTELSSDPQTEVPKEDDVRTVQPYPLNHEYRYEAPFQDHGGHGEPIGTSHFVEDVDLKATETTEPLKSQTDENVYEPISYDEDKNAFENFELPLPRIRPKNTLNSDSKPKGQQQANPKKMTFESEPNESPSKTLKAPLISSDEKPKGKKYPPSKTLENSGGISSSILDELAGIPGGAGRDYPALHKIPEEIDFSCKGRASGFYADMNLRCQVSSQKNFLIKLN